ncbi:MAG: methylmalonyl-CoA mutase [Euryarchaeota archaeon]|nr:methylmalonyl-CoA mutase [Euryarchaeota archaeon]
MVDKPRSTTMSGMDRSNLPTSETAQSVGHNTEGHPVPGMPPYTRGIHSDMYRSKLWTMRQYAGFSTARDTNERFRTLLDNGQTGLSVAFDLPTQLGLDSDHPNSLGEVGRVGVPIDTLDDMKELFNSIDMSGISTSMTINAPATSILAMYVAAADDAGIDRAKLRGTVQNDILKEYIARGLYIYPPEQSMRLTTDLMRWCYDNTPSWNTISISGYHMREAGCTAVEEVALTLSNALQYVTSAIESGLDIDIFAPRMSFFFSSHNDFLEEVSKFRAARMLWHDLIMENFEPTNPRSAQLRFHTQTAGVTLTAQQPLNNTVRVAYQALSAVFGGTQSLHTNSFDEAIGLPTEEAATIALRTQQIIAEETGVPNSVDPLAGSYLVEEMTSRIATEARKQIDNINSKGGALTCVKAGIQQRIIHESAWKNLNSIESGETGVVGVNIHIDDEDVHDSGLKIDPQNTKLCIEKLREHKASRDEADVESALVKLSKVCNDGGNVMEPLIDAAKAGATIGEMNAIMRDVFGTWVSPSGV